MFTDDLIIEDPADASLKIDNELTVAGTVDGLRFIGAADVVLFLPKVDEDKLRRFLVEREKARKKSFREAVRMWMRNW